MPGTGVGMIRAHRRRQLNETLPRQRQVGETTSRARSDSERTGDWAPAIASKLLVVLLLPGLLPLGDVSDGDAEARRLRAPGDSARSPCSRGHIVQSPAMSSGAGLRKTLALACRSPEQTSSTCPLGLAPGLDALLARLVWPSALNATTVGGALTALPTIAPSSPSRSGHIRVPSPWRPVRDEGVDRPKLQNGRLGQQI